MSVASGTMEEGRRGEGITTMGYQDCLHASGTMKEGRGGAGSTKAWGIRTGLISGQRHQTFILVFFRTKCF